MAEVKTPYSVDTDNAVDKYSDMVLRIALTYTRNMTDAQDIYQETFLRLVKYRHTIESEEHLKAWLIRVTTNCAKSFLSKNQAYRTEELDENIPSEETFEVNEQSELYEQVLLMKEKYKTPLYLYYYEGYSVKEIAKCLGEKENTVKSLLSRGRQHLRKALEKEGIHL